MYFSARHITLWHPYVGAIKNNEEKCLECFLPLHISCRAGSVWHPWPDSLLYLDMFLFQSRSAKYDNDYINLNCLLSILSKQKGCF